MPAQERVAAIVGVHEFPLRVAPGMTELQIKAQSIRATLEDAGLSWRDVDAIYDRGDAEGGEGLAIAHYLGFSPNVVDTTQVGGASYEFHAAHAVDAIASGRCNVAVLSYGSMNQSNRVAIGTGGLALPGSGAGNWLSNMEVPFGLTGVANYAMVAQRHMHEYGTRTEDLAEISVATRFHAMRNPEAVKAMTDLQFQGINEITVQDVLDSRVIADPLHLLECCMISDGGGAVVIASPEVARTARKPPVWVIGSGEAVKYRTNGGDITTSAGAQSAPIAFGRAGVRPDEVDIAMVYDSFSITVAVCLEDLGFCAKGDIKDFVRDQRLRFDTPLKPALNTDGGGLSSNHPGARGIFLLIEAVRQLRGESTSQVPDASLAVAHGNGGALGGNHSGGTVILARD